MIADQSAAPDVSEHRLSDDQYPAIFRELNPPLDSRKAEAEASRCYYCFDAPCVRACPTEIDVPSFIRKISNGNVKGAALDILSANIMGGTCARVCPVETLCQRACVRVKADGKPVEIGLLQRFAVDAFLETGEQPFQRMTSNGKRVAVVGAGPAGLSCAHQLARLGYEVTVFEAREKSGGLNEYGLAPYKVTNDFVQREIGFIVGVGGIAIQRGKALGRDFSLDELRRGYAAVFLGIGLGGVNALGVEGEDVSDGPRMIDATRFIAELRQAKDLSAIPIGRNVVVIGGGNTAVDIAIQVKRLGAEFVTMAYRRGQEHMGATPHEQELAQKNGVLIKTWVRPVRVMRGGAIELEYTRLEGTKVVGTGKRFTLKADQIFKAIGQTLDASPLARGQEAPRLANGRIAVNEVFETSLSGVFAGGDCVAVGEDLTVTSVRQGKEAALAIHNRLADRGSHG